MLYYTYEEFAKDVPVMARKIRNEFDPEVILAIARGGMTLGHSLSVALENRNLFALNSVHYDGKTKLDTIEIFNIPDLSKFKRVLISEDIIDSGESMVAVKKRLLEIYPHLEIKIATIYYKSKALLLPDFTVKEANEWVEFFWDIKI
ncbi:phosphoribosyltransferase [Campylobacter sputorum subsp. bubulus]|uniref:Phosphoribosyltransferase n=1 Tax=Campylobacter sputorum subsp. sputorum TaxID=32024 RepID=A0A381DM04_9BACT|nr:phosphoribosyltransferase family protein [Campylobacter sputorum]ASM34838.1 putative nucleotide phosphoribosyltransferase [Campylobacter sputorum aubsp. sputorum RM3237]ASM36503.1 putative nucleotide phosphoribosyltransferase [Campylobacter sputorum bv. faecalis CCUG 20703]ASM38198.1 putative nucleotide phosphoribosyltransferase [Campylobacter sputorum bv. paraureolyticus LMG 11764]KAB0580028.1 phosphoribosyltransferase [Campylobacter sputorum subsp. sputorum]MDY6120000.1 phosphoribosyltran